ncbi:MAG: hypothetical protein L0211_10405 [Planctomycetaceae bacterium]|nr:hypothetical protein [Planctomycetaceae bacterium]
MTIFARDITDDLASLVKQVDEQVGKNKSKDMKAFFVLLTEDADAAAPKLEKLAKDQGITNVPLTVFDGESGPPSYKIAKDADVTVLLWKEQSVKANHAFKKGELNKKGIEAIIADGPKILE